MFDSNKIKSDFPIFDYHPDLIYLDSAATSLKPRVVIAKLKEYYEQYSANVHRGLYPMAGRATDEYEETRQVMARFLNAGSPEEVIFTKSTTEALNMLALSLGQNLKRGDEIMTTIMEHHSNFVPWQMVAKKMGVKFSVIDIDDKMQNLDSRLRGNDNTFENVKILTLTYISNVLGTINPIKEIVRKAKEINPEVIVIVDAAQAVGHVAVDVQELGCDFLVFSGHKMLGPTGVGVLWGRREVLEGLSPVQFGGEMVREVGIENTTWNDIPHRFEAGTPPIAEVIALKKAVRYLDGIGMEDIRAHEQELVAHTIRRMHEEFADDIKILGPKDHKDRGSVISFTLKNYHPHDIAQILGDNNIAVRAGHHCAMPLHMRLGIPASTRVSFGVYNSVEDAEKFVDGLKNASALLQNS